VAAPYGLTVAQVRGLTRAQVREIYLRRRDEWGNLKPEDREEAPEGPEAPLRLLCLQRGWPDWLTEKWLAGLRAAEDGTAAQQR
jgi:hypothetical protein